MIDYKTLYFINPELKCKQFLAQPVFIRMGLLYGQRQKCLKKQKFNQRHVLAEIIKERGNRFFQLGFPKKQFIFSLLGLYQQAAQEYEQSLSVFNYIELRNSKLKFEQLQDEDFIYNEYKCESDRERGILLQLRLKIYQNLAICYIRMQMNSDAIKACDHALMIDQNSIKAYYRRARARLQFKNLTVADYICARQDLQNACIRDPNDQDIRRELMKIDHLLNEIQSQEQFKKYEEFQQQQLQQQELQKQQMKFAQMHHHRHTCPEHAHVHDHAHNHNHNHEQQQKQYNFDDDDQYNDDEYYDEEGEIDGEGDIEGDIGEEDNNQITNKQAQEFWRQFNINKDYENFNYELSYEQDPTKQIPQEVVELGRFIETRGMEILRIYENSGKKKEADELREKLTKAMAAKQQLERISQLDFNRPKQKLQEIAKNFGIDLYDPTVQQEFQKIQAQNLQDIRLWLQQNQWNYTPFDNVQHQIPENQRLNQQQQEYQKSKQFGQNQQFQYQSQKQQSQQMQQPEISQNIQKIQQMRQQQYQSQQQLNKQQTPQMQSQQQEFNEQLLIKQKQLIEQQEQLKKQKEAQEQMSKEQQQDILAQNRAELLMRLQGRKKLKAPPRVINMKLNIFGKHKNKFNKRTQIREAQKLKDQQNENQPVNITNNVIYNQTFNNSQNVTNYTGQNQVYEDKLPEIDDNLLDQAAPPEQEEDESFGCMEFISNNYIILISIILLAVTVYYQFFT